MKSIAQYIAAVREMVRERIRILSEYDRTELDYDQDLKRTRSRGSGREPTIAKRPGTDRIERG
jgi:hypothetical protein